MIFPHRSPPALRFAALAAGVLDLFLGVALLVIGMRQPDLPALRLAGWFLIATSWLVPWLLLAVRYEVEGGELRVTRAFLTRRIPLEAIDAIGPPAALAGPMGSGLLVRYRVGGRRSLESVQPVDASEFLRHVRMSAPHLETAGEGALQRPGVPT